MKNKSVTEQIKNANVNSFSDCTISRNDFEEFLKSLTNRKPPKQVDIIVGYKMWGQVSVLYEIDKNEAEKMFDESLSNKNRLIFSYTSPSLQTVNYLRI